VFGLLCLLAVGMSLGGTTGYAINPARDLGPRIAHFLLPIPGKGDSNWGIRVGLAYTTGKDAYVEKGSAKRSA
jgi:glycerol uptake facilitator-like aquaporin